MSDIIWRRYKGTKIQDPTKLECNASVVYGRQAAIALSMLNPRRFSAGEPTHTWPASTMGVVELTSAPNHLEKQ
jgi:hypothetical protein